MRRFRKQGFTLIELIISIVLFAILASVTVYVFRAVLLSWSTLEERTGVDISLVRAPEGMVRDLRKAKNIDSKNNDEIRFTTRSNTDHIYYLYNGNDMPYPPGFTQNRYELRKVGLNNVVAGDLKTGTFTYGSGRIIITDVLPPPTTDLSFLGITATIDISIQRDNETVKSRTEVKLRN